MRGEPSWEGWVEVATYGQGKMLHWIGDDGYPLCGVPGEWPYILHQQAELGAPFCPECLENQRTVDKKRSRLL